MAAYLPYPKQENFHSLGTEKRERMLMAGNQLGKTAAAGFETSCHLTGEYPDWWEGKRFAGPIIAWVGNTTNEMVRDNPQRTLMGEVGNWGTGTIPRSKILKRPTMSRGFPDMIDTVPIIHNSGGTSILQFKAYKQGREAWAGRSVDLIWCDEEPDRVIYGEILARITATGGIVMLTMTPLLGMSEVVSKFYPAPNTNQRSLTQFEIWDVGHLTREEKQVVVDGYPEHEREARSLGIPMLGEGMIFQVPPSTITSPIFAIPKHWRLAGGLDFGYGDHPFAAVKIAYDSEADIIYVTHEYKDKSNNPTIHCASLKAWGEDTKFFWPHDGQRQWGDSGPVAGVYRSGGLKMHFEHSTFPEGGYSPEACCVEVLTRMQTGRFKVFEHCGNVFHEISTYHRKDGQIVKLNDDLLSAIFKCVMMLRLARTEADPRATTTKVQGDWDELSAEYLEDEEHESAFS